MSDDKKKELVETLKTFLENNIAIKDLQLYKKLISLFLNQYGYSSSLAYDYTHKLILDNNFNEERIEM